MLGLGILTQTQVDTLDADTIEHFHMEYGIDLSDRNPAVLVFPNGSRIVSGVAALLPAIFGNVPDQTWYVIQDTNNPQREYKWIQYECVTLVQFLSDYTVPAAFVKSDANIVAGSLYFRGFIINGRSKDGLPYKWYKKRHREVFAAQPEQVSNQQANMWGQTTFAIPYTMIDCAGNVGFGISTTLAVNRPEPSVSQAKGGIPTVEGRIVYTFVNVDNNVSDCE
jgi:hypothetical protein